MISFSNSGDLASAYGIAVTSVMVITSLLAFVVFRRVWSWPLPSAAAVLAPLLAIELIFLGANLSKLADGGFVPLLLAAVIGLLMWTWVRGARIVLEKAQAQSSSLADLLQII